MICSICLSSLKKARLLPCNHKFHPRCIQQWIEIDNSCPLCRKPIEDDGEMFIKNLVFDLYLVLFITVIQLLHLRFTFFIFMFTFMLNSLLVIVRNVCFAYYNVE